MRRHCLEVKGDFACFTRPEMKVERVSYDVITPSAARSIFEAVLWKPAIRWQIHKIEVLKPIRWISLRRNEVGAVASIINAKETMTRGSGDLGIFIEEERQQRAGLFLRDVAYRIHGSFDLTPRAQPDEHEVKFAEMFTRRAGRGQCVNQPYLGCREFAASFSYVESPEKAAAAIEETRELGFMLYDLDFEDPTDPKPRFFRAQLKSGIVDIPDWNSKEVVG